MDLIFCIRSRLCIEHFVFLTGLLHIKNPHDVDRFPLMFMDCLACFEEGQIAETLDLTRMLGVRVISEID